MDRRDHDAARPRNIYGVTKLAAEELCRLFNHLHRLPVLVLRTSRFFPEEDDMAHAIVQSGENTKANEFLFRGSASRMRRGACRRPVKGEGDRFRHLHRSAADAVPPRGLPRPDHGCPRGGRPPVPEYRTLYDRRGWTMFDTIDRVYDAAKAERVLGFRCRTDFAAILAGLR